MGRYDLEIMDADDAAVAVAVVVNDVVFVAVVVVVVGGLCASRLKNDVQTNDKGTTYFCQMSTLKSVDRFHFKRY